jgi:VWFA-related protein
MMSTTSVPGAAFRLSAVLLALGLAGGLELVGYAQQQPPPVFRSRVELIAVDVQVMDNDGNPIGKLGPNAFDVSINGKRRRVVSAEFIRHAENQANPISSGAVAAPFVSPAEDPLAASTARTVILAVDAGSFTPGDTQAVMEAARGFVRGLGPDDLLGLYVFPTVTWIPPTTQRAPIAVRLESVHGEKEPIRSYYNLAPHEIVDITAQSTNPNSFLTVARTGDVRSREGAAALDPVLKIQARECPGQENDIDCAIKIYSEGMTLATQLEREAQLSLGGLDSMLRMLAEMPGRKSVVLISGGLLLSDRLDGRPDTGNLARTMGQSAARANATIYTIHIDNVYPNPGLASKKGIGDMNFSRDRAMLGNWLEDFSRSAGGKRIEVPVGGGEYAFTRVLKETSAYYLLGVEPSDVDRDGRAHELKVKVDRSKTTVRNRQWVVIPPRQQASRF